MGRRLLSLLKIVPELVSFYSNDRKGVSFSRLRRDLMAKRNLSLKVNAGGLNVSKLAQK
jgi:hypothetical protein